MPRVSEIIKDAFDSESGTRISQIRQQRRTRRCADAMSRLSEAAKELQALMGEDDPEIHETLGDILEKVGRLQKSTRG
jgi:ABC-type transporter Mla subunit MlaD